MTRSITSNARHQDEALFDAADHRPTRRGLVSLVAAGSLAVMALVALGSIPGWVKDQALEEEAKANSAASPLVDVIRARREAAGVSIALPGTIQPLQETAMYARANGYVRKWYVDIGAEVKRGQVLADLDLPDVDQELRRARADAKQASASVTQAESRLAFARSTNDRFSALGASGLISKQETDQYSSAYEVRQANLEAARAAEGSADANVRRVEQLKSFGTITAPFDGVVTMRAAEVGQLVTSGTGLGQPLFKIAEDDVVRIFINVPQLYAAGVKPGRAASVTVRELPGRAFAGAVARTSRALDTLTRTLLVEVDVQNPDRALVAGMYAKIALEVDRQDAPLFVPATAALIDASGIRVALVRDGRIHWQAVELANDLGDRMAIASGLSEGDAVVTTPSERLSEGLKVQVRTPH